eukprot:Rhum_TRINITY_DN19272_c0_g1::Rhum_TRINITY_DN19272_c0_g1_i1::g.169688::m.169688
MGPRVAVHWREGEGGEGQVARVGMAGLSGRHGTLLAGLGLGENVLDKLLHLLIMHADVLHHPLRLEEGEEPLALLVVQQVPDRAQRGLGALDVALHPQARHQRHHRGLLEHRRVLVRRQHEEEAAEAVVELAFGVLVQRCDADLRAVSARQPSRACVSGVTLNQGGDDRGEVLQHLLAEWLLGAPLNCHCLQLHKKGLEDVVARKLAGQSRERCVVVCDERESVPALLVDLRHLVQHGRRQEARHRRLRVLLVDVVHSVPVLRRRVQQPQQQRQARVLRRGAGRVRVEHRDAELDGPVEHGLRHVLVVVHRQHQQRVQPPVAQLLRPLAVAAQHRSRLHDGALRTEDGLVRRRRRVRQSEPAQVHDAPQRVVAHRLVLPVLLEHPRQQLRALPVRPRRDLRAALVVRVVAAERLHRGAAHGDVAGVAAAQRLEDGVEPALAAGGVHAAQAADDGAAPAPAARGGGAACEHRGRGGGGGGGGGG